MPQTATTAATPRRILFLETSPHHPTALGAIEYGRRAGWAMTFSSAYGRPIAVVARRWHADGVLVGGGPQDMGGMMKQWRQCRVPMVSTNDLLTDRRGLASALLDFRASGRMAARHFIDAGFRNLAYCWLGDIWTLNEQLAGFREAAETARVTLHTLDWTARVGKDSRSYSDTFRRWLLKQVSDLPKPLGVMVESDWTGIEAVGGLCEGGILIPEQVAVVSCFNVEPVCEGALVPLSSVDMNWYEQGYRAGALLDGLMDGATAPTEPVWIEPKGVVVRGSSDVVAVPHEGVAQVMSLIREGYHDPDLTVTGLAKTVGISTVGLNKAFQKHLGVSPSERLRQARLRGALTLLETTARPVAEIAAASGYGTVKQLIRSVTKATGRTPRAWRKQQKAQAATPAPQA